MCYNKKVGPFSLVIRTSRSQREDGSLILPRDILYIFYFFYNIINA